MGSSQKGTKATEEEWQGDLGIVLLLGPGTGLPGAEDVKLIQLWIEHEPHGYVLALSIAEVQTVRRYAIAKRGRFVALSHSLPVGSRGGEKHSEFLPERLGYRGQEVRVGLGFKVASHEAQAQGRKLAAVRVEAPDCGGDREQEEQPHCGYRANDLPLVHASSARRSIGAGQDARKAPSTRLFSGCPFGAAVCTDWRRRERGECAECWAGVLERLNAVSEWLRQV